MVAIAMPADGTRQHRAGRRVGTHPKLKMVMIEAGWLGAVTVGGSTRLKSCGEVPHSAQAVGIHP
jgi:hypothetical protein